MLLSQGCQTTSSQPTPAYLQFQGGNAWVIDLPAGSKVTVNDPKILIPATNEINPDGTLRQACVIVSKSYIDKRDETEIELMKTVEEFKQR